MFRPKHVLFSLPSLLVFLVLLLPAPAGAVEDRIMAKVGDETITESQVKEYMASVNLAGAPPASEREALEDLINRSILYQEAKKKGIDTRKDVREQIEKTKRNIVVQALMKDEKIFSQPVTEEMARKLYEENWMDSRYPRWVKLTLVRIAYKDNSLMQKAEEYAESLRSKIESGEFDKDPEAALNKVKEQLPPPDGVTLTATQYKKIYLLKVRQIPAVIEQEPLKMKEGETSRPIPVPQHPEFVLINLTKEYPKEEVPFDRVKGDLMLSGARMLQQERLKTFSDKLREDYKIEYFTK
ncbi:MAG: peptidylprolyl isomerase [Nitrospirota bacterium]